MTNFLTPQELENNVVIDTLIMSDLMSNALKLLVGPHNKTKYYFKNFFSMEQNGFILVNKCLEDLRIT